VSASKTIKIRNFSKHFEGCFDGLGFYGNGTNGSIRSQDYKVLQDGTIVVARKFLLRSIVFYLKTNILL